MASSILCAIPCRPHLFIRILCMKVTAPDGLVGPQLRGASVMNNSSRMPSMMIYVETLTSKQTRIPRLYQEQTIAGRNIGELANEWKSRRPRMYVLVPILLYPHNSMTQAGQLVNLLRRGDSSSVLRSNLNTVTDVSTRTSSSSTHTCIMIQVDISRDTQQEVNDHRSINDAMKMSHSQTVSTWSK
ncbi:hypothetical protein PILCRDRAFT_455144 [Piloderma croceum F 1598]|uniref:Uncharacterized protein n=1 Tax=Piloderma croceum (strain F 1598) TaxID=765440 RepID=A0A0C3FW23_PILCF|nr:hypothetical protein PILCRDRAFT_455144 [Piloderma croceum F 1598]